MVPAAPPMNEQKPLALDIHRPGTNWPNGLFRQDEGAFVASITVSNLIREFKC